MRTVVHVVVGLVLALVVLAGLWPVARHRLIYPGGTLSPDRSGPGSHGLPHGEEVWLDASDGVRIHAWWVPGREDRSASHVPGEAESGNAARSSARTGRARGAVVYCHGNAETMATRAWIADRLSRLGYHTLLFDYRGYGLSEGRASEEGIARDARAAWRHVVEARGVTPNRVILMGHSLGSSVATRLALELGAAGPSATEDGEPTAEAARPAGLVVGSPFPSMPALFAHHAPWLPDRALRWRTDRLDAGSRLGEVRMPKLVIIGTEDDVIPPAMSREVYYEAGGRAGEGTAEPSSPMLVTVPADHATLMGHPAVWTALARFMDAAIGTEG